MAPVGGVVVLEARPAYTYLSVRAYGPPISPGEMVAGFGRAVLLCLAATFTAIRVALARLEAVER